MKTPEAPFQTFLYNDKEVPSSEPRHEHANSQIDYELLRKDVLDYLDELDTIIYRKEQSGHGPDWAHDRFHQLWDFAIDQGFVEPLSHESESVA